MRSTTTPRRRVTRLLWIAAAIGLAAAALIYRDLLRAAVTLNPVPADQQSRARADALWKLDCEVCHGSEGRGDGVAAVALPRKPKDLTRIARPPIFPDGVLAYRIANGGVVMPAWKNVLTERDIWDLVNFIRAHHQ
jgi:putative copper resistance protein D